MTENCELRHFFWLCFRVCADRKSFVLKLMGFSYDIDEKNIQDWLGSDCNPCMFENKFFQNP